MRAGIDALNEKAEQHGKCKIAFPPMTEIEAEIDAKRRINCSPGHVVDRGDTGLNTTKHIGEEP